MDLTTYVAAKDLVIDGRRYAKGAPIDQAAVGADRVANGVRIGAIVAGSPPPPANPEETADAE